MANPNVYYEIETYPLLRGFGSDVQLGDGFGAGDLGADEPIVVTPPGAASPFRKLTDFLGTPFGLMFLAGTGFLLYRGGYFKGIQRFLSEESTPKEQEE